jgi:hypothetical protein
MKIYHMMVVDFDNEDHSMEKDMNRHNRLVEVDVEYIHHHLYILHHYPNK